MDLVEKGSLGCLYSILFDVWIPSAIVAILFVILIKPIRHRVTAFYADWLSDDEHSSLWFGLIILILVFGAGLGLLPMLGRTQTLMLFGGLMLLVTIINLIAEKSK